MTHRQGDVLFCLAQRKTFREIASEMGISSTNGVMDHVKSLMRQGLVHQERGKGRSFRYSPTFEGMKALGLARCFHCQGSGWIKVVS